MFSMLYFPVVSALATPSPFPNDGVAERFLDAVCEGKLHAASQLTSRWFDEADHAGMTERTLYGLQLHADLQLILNVEVEAEENYRRSQTMIRSSKRAIRTASCRNAAWQALYRHRLGTALACFSRVIDEPEIEPARAAEAHFGIVCTMHELGRARDAANALKELAQRVERCLDDENGLWRDLIETLRFDLAAQMEIRCASALGNHVYWQSDLSSDRAPLILHDAGDAIETMREPLSAVRAPLLRARIKYLRQLRLATCADRDAIGGLHQHLNWANDQGLGGYQRTLRLEIALATLAGQAPHHAHEMLEPLHQLSRNGSTGHRQIEYLYCTAKMRQSQGRVQESLQLYSRYALVAMQCLREASQLRTPLLSHATAPALQLDDVGARLPARYRRAYSYLLDNLERRDLSVREVAAEIGVTERALQSAFKRFLGLSPTELIRRQRMERIRAELTDSSWMNERGVLDVASKWGVQNRSALANGYRKQFQETPSETRKR
ncbi:helix-turn-helix transcriptional regulator [Paraburkholderia sp.]|uniref:helix-turn-helix transcriptional regulator n=1 Tax=Paraburkholderia sp. TaxID=1926495 RepID=UPI003C7DFAA9